MDRLSVAMVGAGRRAAGAWLPAIDVIRYQLRLTAVCNTGAERGDGV